jgi:cyclophilin family peptidyl-prolyl cis-trans isomerase
MTLNDLRTFGLLAAVLLTGNTITYAYQVASDTATAADNATQVEENTDSAEAQAFLELRKNLQANQERIDFLYRTLPIGFPEKRKESKAEIEQLTAANEKLKSEVFSKAKAAYKASDKPTAYTTKILRDRLIGMLRPRSNKDQFQPNAALELITLLKEKNPDNPSLLEYEFLSNYAVERFEKAQEALEKLELATQSDLSQPKQELAETIEKYQQELMIRRQEANTDDLPRVRLTTTEGDIILELYENHAPNTVANFIHLIRDQKFYDGKLFHLVRAGEYCQSGSPNGDGIGGAGYYIPCECYGEKIRGHFRGTISMLANEKDRGSSQFLITQQPNPHTFDGRYTAFGRVISGMDVVMKLKNVDLSGRLSSTADVSKIVSAEVLRSRSHEYLPEKIASVSSAIGFPQDEASMKNGQNSADESNTDVEASGSFDMLIESDKNDGGGN